MANSYKFVLDLKAVNSDIGSESFTLENALKGREVY